jgi:hypothetical protein
MDQDTSNTPGKARWRERLGMGNSGKEMPKISDEFKPVSPPPPKSAPPRGPGLPPAKMQGQPQPVTRPAPMAPRTPPQASGARPVQPVPQGAAGLGDRLRAERQAAERLAEQRVAQARGKGMDRPLTPPQNLAPPPKSAAPERPKFSFSPEELAKDKREAAPPPEREFPTFSGKSSTSAPPPPPLTPPRPALGNAGAQRQAPPPKPQASTPPPPRPQASNPPPKPQPSNPPPAGPAFQPRYNGPPQPTGGNYRSLDPPPGSLTPRPRPYADTAAFREEPSPRRDDPLARRPVPAVNREYDSYRRGPALPPQPAYGEEAEGPSFSADYRRRQPTPVRARQPAYDEDVNEVFEDDEPQRPQRRRASAQDYNRAYRDYEDGYDAEAPRRRGPWLWLLGIALLAMVVAAGIVYYYLTFMKPEGQANGNVPTIEAPEQGAKTAPETQGGSASGTQGAVQPSAGDRKQIYDRILGDDEVGGNQVVPTQEQPQTVQPTGDNEGQGAAPIPNPASGTQDNSAEPLPLPLPPPGDQGSLPGNANQQTAALGAVNKGTAPQPVAEPASTNTAADDNAPVPGQLAKMSEQVASTPPPQPQPQPQPQVEQIVSDPEPVPVETVKPAKAKVKAEKKTVQKVAAVDAVDDGQQGGVEPLVLVPPAQPANNQAQVAEPDASPQTQNVENTATEQKSKSFFNFGTSGKRKLTGKAAEQANARGAGTSGNWANSPDPSKPAADGEPQQQVASIAPQPAPEPIPAPEPQPQQPVNQAKPSGTGYVAQLASFRSEAEAMAEYDRLRAKHANVLNGLSPRVVKAKVAGGDRYRLGVGPMASRDAASKLCNSLIAAGERDCLVRGN